jgi:hypothetical protein
MPRGRVAKSRAREGETGHVPGTCAAHVPAHGYHGEVEIGPARAHQDPGVSIGPEDRPVMNCRTAELILNSFPFTIGDTKPEHMLQSAFNAALTKP